MDGQDSLTLPSIKTFVLVLTPILLLPLPISTAKIEFVCAYVILLMAIYWMAGCLCIGVTSCIPVFLFPITGVMSMSEVTSVFLFPGIWLLIGSLILAISAQSSKLHLRIALKILLTIGTSPNRLLLGFMLTTFVMSMWIPNIVTAAVMLPIVEGVILETKSQYESSPPEEDSSSVQAIPFLETNKERDEQSNNVKIERKTEDKDLSGVIVESELRPKTTSQSDAMLKRLSKSLTIGVPYAATIGGNATITGCAPNIIAVSILKRSFPGTDEISFSNWFAFSFPTQLCTVVACYIWLAWLFTGFRSLRTRTNRPHKDVELSGAKKVLTKQYKELGSLNWEECWVMIVFAVTIVLWFTRNPTFLRGWSVLFAGKDVNDGTVVMATSFLLFLIPKNRPVIWSKGNYKKQVRTTVPKILSWKDVNDRFHWEIIFIFGGGMLIAEGAKKSGLSYWFTSQLGFLLNSPPWLACLTLSVVAMLLTECISNTAVTNLMLPIIIQLAISMRVHPYYLCLPPVLSTSLAFMLPVATPPNLFAYATGNIEIKDLVKAGWFMNLIGVAFITLSINSYAIAIFDLSEFPSWANNTHT